MLFVGFVVFCFVLILGFVFLLGFFSRLFWVFWGVCVYDNLRKLDYFRPFHEPHLQMRLCMLVLFKKCVFVFGKISFLILFSSEF